MLNLLRTLSGAMALALLANPAASSAESFGDILKRRIAEAVRARSTGGTAVRTGRTSVRPMDNRRGAIVDDRSPTYEVTAEEEQLARTGIDFNYSEKEVDRIQNILSARMAVARRDQQACQRKTGDYDGCDNDPNDRIASFFTEVPASVQASIQSLPVSYDGLKTLQKIVLGFEMWARYENHGNSRQVVNLYSTIQNVIEPRRLQIEAVLQPQIIADMAAGKSGLMFDLFGIDPVRTSYYKEGVAQRAELAKAPSPSTNEGKILTAALQSLYNAPGFALARGFDLAEKRPGSVRFSAAGTVYEYTVDVRNAKCQVLKTGTSCDYEMKLGLDVAIMGMKIPSPNLAWTPRRDVFQNRAGKFASTSLDLAMHKVAASQSSGGARSSSGGGTDLAAESRNNVELMQNLQDVNDGLYSTGRIIY